MEQPETIEPEYIKIKKEHEIKIGNNKIRIELNNNDIIFSLIIDLSFNKYIKRFKHDEFQKHLNFPKDMNIGIDEIYEDLKNYEYEINEAEKKISLWGIDIKLEEEIRLTNEEMIKELVDEIKNLKNEKNDLEKQVYELDNIVNKDKYKNEINLIYNTDVEDEYQIFGDEFVRKNNKNIELNINGNKSKLVNKYILKEGENNIKMIIKDKIKDLQHMFDSCENLPNIDELKYLNVKYCINFSYMFFDCSSLNDISPLENWIVTKGTNFSHMLCDCSLLKDIRPLENWDVSKGTNFSYMFAGCKSLNSIRPLENWNISKGNNFSYMFAGCESLNDIKPLEKWNVSNGTDFSRMFRDCESLKDIKPLEKWNLDKNNFESMFRKY